MLASDGRQDYSSRAVARAAALAGDGPVAVVTIAKIYGSSFGLPHPGTAPDERRARQSAGVGWRGRSGALQADGVAADGQVAATRRAAKKLAAVARARGARVIVIDETTVTNRLRRVIEGDVGAELRRKLRKDGIEVEVDAAETLPRPDGRGVDARYVRLQLRRAPGAEAAREPEAPRARPAR